MIMGDMVGSRIIVFTFDFLLGPPGPITGLFPFSPKFPGFSLILKCLIYRILWPTQGYLFLGVFWSILCSRYRD